MKILAVLALTILSPVLAATEETRDIGAVLDSFHAAAAQGDKDGYLVLMADDGVFLGTDEWERWPKQPDFVEYVGGRFKDGVGWNYRSVDRNIRVDDSGELAWFDEVLYSEQNGRFRGTGVLTKKNGSWKIAHYAMSFLILNENWPEVIELTKKTMADKEQGESGE